MTPMDFRDSVSFLLARAAQKVQKSTEAGLRELGFDARHYGVLAMLNQPRPWSQQALANLIGVDRTTMVALVDRLEELGYVERRRDPNDRRRHALKLTEHGKAASQLATAVLVECEATLLAPLSQTERDQLGSLVRRLLV